MKSALLATVLGAAAIALPSTGSAQAPAPCAPDQTAGVEITTEDRVQDGTNNPLYATHEVYFSADVAGDATNVRIAPQAGVTVLEEGSRGQNLDLVVPAPPSLAVTVSWNQPASSSDPTPCSASTTRTFPVLKARPSRVKLFKAPRTFAYDVDFKVIAAVSRQNLAPIELTLRRSARAKLPSPSSKPLRWSIPMRDGEQRPGVKGRPRNTILGTRRGCEISDFSCGAVFAEVGQLNIDGSLLRGLSFNRPFRYAARFGVDVDVRPGGVKVRPFGFDIQARQDGKLIARYQRAGVCRDVRRFGGIFRDCPLSVVKNYPR